jgi:hypothetical protein
MLPARPTIAAALCCFAASLCPAQITSPSPAASERPAIGIIQGDLVETEGNVRTGAVTLRTAEAKIVRCTYDEKTYFERERYRITPLVLRAGDRLEIVSDRKIASSEVCSARTVHVLDAVTANRLKSRPGLRSFSSNFDLLVPRGNLTFAGVVTRVDLNQVVLRTRTGGPLTILLRPDTRYLAEGHPVEPGALKVNTRVFIRAGKTFEDEMEAFQVVWGTILSPQD